MARILSSWSAQVGLPRPVCLLCITSAHNCAVMLELGGVCTHTDTSSPLWMAKVLEYVVGVGAVYAAPADLVLWRGLGWRRLGWWWVVSGGGNGVYKEARRAQKGGLLVLVYSTWMQEAELALKQNVMQQSPFSALGRAGCCTCTPWGLFCGPALQGAAMGRL